MIDIKNEISNDIITYLTKSPGRLPNADMGTIGGTIQHVRDIFGRMGFTDREIVALIGAHAVGRCHENASGKIPTTRSSLQNIHTKIFALTISITKSP